MSAVFSVLSSRTSRRVLLIGASLSFMHTVGIMITLYLLFTRLLDPAMADRPKYNICTTAITCPFYKVFFGITGIVIQLAGSACGLSLNLALILGVVNNVTKAILMWLVAYMVGIVGCVVLFGVVLHILIARQNAHDDVQPAALVLWPLLPLLLAFLYIVCWVIVFFYWRKARRRKDTQAFTCLE